MTVTNFNQTGIVVAGTEDQISQDTILNNGMGIDVTGNDNSIGVASSAGVGPTFGGNQVSGNSVYGIQVGGSGNLIQDNLIGTDAAGMNAVGNVSGVELIGPGNTISDCVISGNTSDGILISGVSAAGNTVTGSKLGTDVSGTKALGNGDGVDIINNSSSNTIGGTVNGSENVISGNAVTGINVLGDVNATANLIEGNLIGTDISGKHAIGNLYGVQFSGSPGNTLGGTTSSARNIISGNTGDGVQIGFAGSGTSINSNKSLIEGNYIGTDVTGTHALANSGDGIDISGILGAANQPFEGDRMSVLSCRFPRSYQLCREATLMLLNDVFERLDEAASPRDGGSGLVWLRRMEGIWPSNESGVIPWDFRPLWLEIFGPHARKGITMSELKNRLILRQEAQERRIAANLKPFVGNPAGNQSRPVEPDQQPEASLAWWVGNCPCEA